jgi:hypothetical protein
MSSEGFSIFEKHLYFFSENNSEHPIMSDSPLQIVMAV